MAATPSPPKFIPDAYLYDLPVNFSDDINRANRKKRSNRGMNSRGSTRIKPDRRYKRRIIGGR